MNNDFIDEWTAELRSGNRAQTKATLGSVVEGEERFCCLGVAQEVLVARGLCERRVDGRTIRYSTDADGKLSWESDVLTHEAMELIGVDDTNPSIELAPREEDIKLLNDGRPDYRDSDASLAELNDVGLTFNQIADVIDYFIRD